jgi:2-keto-4-pentenoate hydratase/2-oxohepta-3-ene-1,7-dioic acid hydratase in catechol pathway
MKIICIGRNYAEHAKEMNAPLPATPVFFMKPDTAVLKNGGAFYYPEFTKDLHYECELVVRIEKAGKHISTQFAHKYYTHVSLGIDFTARDLQQECKEKGLPWEIANGEIVQTGNTSDMIFSIDEIISYISRFMTLKTGDLIFTGTPSGVGPVKIGDHLTGALNGQDMFTFDIK